jgi:hypothetical protein
VISLIAVLVVGILGGYLLREPLKKIINGKNTSEEIKKAVDLELAKFESNKDKFEIEGIVTDININARLTKIKILKSSRSINTLGLAEVYVNTPDALKVNLGGRNDLKNTDIPINSSVKVGGMIKGANLLATRVVILKEDAGSLRQNQVVAGGTITNIGTDTVTLKVATFNKLAEAQKGKELAFKFFQSTYFERANLPISSDALKVGDEISAIGALDQNNYLASKILVKTKESAEIISQEPVVDPTPVSN